METVQAKDRDGLEALLSADAEALGYRAPNGSSLLSLTAYMRHPELAELILRRGVQPDVFEASALGDLEAVREAVRAKPEDANACAPDGFYPLSLASYFGHRRVVEFLLKSVADVHAAARNAQKVTALHAGASGGDLEIVAMLLEAGADPNARQEGGFVPPHSAAQTGNTPLVELLLKHGAKADARNNKGKTPGDVAEEAKHPELAARLRGVKA